MQQVTPTRKQLAHAAHAIVEFAIISLGPDFLRWTKDVNLGTAEFIWNCRGEVPPGPQGDQDFAEMVRTLGHAKRTKWKNDDFMVLDLDVRRNGNEALFTFELSWDEFETAHPCEIAWDPKGMPESALN